MSTIALSAPAVGATLLEQRRDELGGHTFAPHHPAWRWVEHDARFAWLMDGERGVLLLDREQDVLELRCHGPRGECPPVIVPRHYHTPTQLGVRLIYAWRLRGKGCGERRQLVVATGLAGEVATLTNHQQWSDGTQSTCEIRIAYDPAWGAYTVTATATLRARRVTTMLEFCNILPAAIGDSRPARERFPHTLWAHPQGLRKLLKNPLWFCSAGAQDVAGEKRIAPGGFLGFGPDDRLNPVVEILATDPPCGAMTCDGLQDEHLMVLPPGGRHSAATGWYELHAHWRLLSLPRELMVRLVHEAAWMTPGALLAWKFQYPPTAELPPNLARVALPGSPFEGAADWSQPVPWDQPYRGQLWTASPDPAAAIHYDRAVGHDGPGSIRLRVSGGERLVFSPGTGHTRHLEAGTRYRYTMWIRTAGAVHAWIECHETLYRPADVATLPSQRVGPDTAWTQVEVMLTARGDDAPFAITAIAAEGQGQAWFADMVFSPVSG